MGRRLAAGTLVHGLLQISTIQQRVFAGRCGAGRAVLARETAFRMARGVCVRI